MPKVIQKLAFLLICIVGLSGCEDTIKELVDKKFPPVSIDQYRETAIATASASLAAMQSPDVVVVLRLDDVQRALDSTDTFTNANVKEVMFEGDSQLLLAEIHIDGVFTSSMFPDMDAKSAEILDLLKPNLDGVLKIGASMTSAVAAGARPNMSLDFIILPLFSEMRIKELTDWNTIELDGSIPGKDIKDWIDASYDLVVASLTKKERAALGTDQWGKT